MITCFIGFFHLLFGMSPIYGHDNSQLVKTMSGGLVSLCITILTKIMSYKENNITRILWALQKK